jgi:Tfp pilus assembly protein PilN
MLEINLLPGGPRKKAAGGGAPSVDIAAMIAGLNARFTDKVLVGTVAVMIISLGAGAYLYYRQTHDRSVAEERLEKALADSARYAKVVAERNIAEAKRDTLQRQVNLIRAIDDDRYIWPHIMDEISTALPAYTWITLLSFAGTPQGAVNVVQTPALPPPKKADSARAKKPPKIETAVPRDNVVLRLTGRTVDIQAMTRFTKQLEDSPFLANVTIERTIPMPDAAGDTYQFNLVITYTRPDSSSVRRLPLLATARR